MKLNSMHLENFRGFTDLEVSFDPSLTVFVGENGTGKTTILDAIAVLLKQIPLFIQGSYYGEKNISDIRIGAESTLLNYTMSTDIKNYEITLNIVKKRDFALEENPISKNIDFINQIKSYPIPILVYYSAKREINKYQRELSTSTNLKAAYSNAFEPYIDFSTALSWFIDKSSEEALEAVRTKNLEHHLPELQAVRQAVSKALGHYNEPYVSETPPKLLITKKEAPDIPLNLHQLSDGCRTMLALVMDLSRRMAIANSGLPLDLGETILHRPAIVLIDEIEQHLHPAWQQTVLPTLMEIFPKTQFIVTTHSPQVITSIESAKVRIISEGDKVYAAPKGTLGAEASRIMKQVFGVENRPPSEARDQLQEYRRLVYADQGEIPSALKLRDVLNKRYGLNEPELVELDMYIENRKWEMSE
ncbi:MAG: AAA family ATPase [Desulfovibrionaceae bacterium]|nr:AAA family ATPase [Desulfovibrionaceae bacterium]